MFIKETRENFAEVCQIPVDPKCVCYDPAQEHACMDEDAFSNIYFLNATLFFCASCITISGLF